MGIKNKLVINDKDDVYWLYERKSLFVRNMSSKRRVKAQSIKNSYNLVIFLN